ncbi:MAG: MFS transporter [Dehalococcoidia bacterium]|jgi:MFS family permease|nr:MFS transporter [Dehalococcoidia bacterium]
MRITLPPALQYRDYRRFWLAMLSAVGGFQILTFGQFWLIHELTGSTLYLGYVGLASAIPAITLNLVGGVVADRFDKVRLITISQTASAMLVLLLALLTISEVVRPWHVLSIAVVAGAVNAFNQPARQSLYPQLVDKSVMGSAVALNSSIWQGTRILAPAIAGALIAAFGTASAFFVAAGMMLVLSIVVNLLRVTSQTPGRSSSAIQDVGEGLRFIRTNPVFMFLISMTFFNSFFGMSYIIMMPVFAKDILGVGAEGQGVMMMAGGVGSLLMGLWLGTRSNYDQKGFVVIGGAVMTGLSLAAFALTSEYISSFPLAIALMLVTGVFTSTYMISIMSSLQMLVPNEMRGRVMGFYGMTWNIMPLGGMFAGALAAATGTPWAVAIGGFIVAGFALGPALMSSQVRQLGQTIRAAEQVAARPA